MKYELINPKGEAYEFSDMDAFKKRVALCAFAEEWPPKSMIRITDDSRNIFTYQMTKTPGRGAEISDPVITAAAITSTAKKTPTTTYANMIMETYLATTARNHGQLLKDAIWERQANVAAAPAPGPARPPQPAPAAQSSAVPPRVSRARSYRLPDSAVNYSITGPDNRTFETRNKNAFQKWVSHYALVDADKSLYDKTGAIRYKITVSDPAAENEFNYHLTKNWSRVGEISNASRAEASGSLMRENAQMLKDMIATGYREAAMQSPAGPSQKQPETTRAGEFKQTIQASRKEIASPLTAQLERIADNSDGKTNAVIIRMQNALAISGSYQDVRTIAKNELAKGVSDSTVKGVLDLVTKESNPEKACVQIEQYLNQVKPAPSVSG